MVSMPMVRDQNKRHLLIVIGREAGMGLYTNPLNYLLANYHVLIAISTKSCKHLSLKAMVCIIAATICDLLPAP